MFLNIPPNDYNMDETINSLYYGTRVKCITNDCSKNNENKEMLKLKENFKLLLEENEILKKGVKKTAFSQKDNLRILLNNTSASDSHNKSEDVQVSFDNFSTTDNRNYNSLI
jgi:hypothetical protein